METTTIEPGLSKSKPVFTVDYISPLQTLAEMLERDCPGLTVELQFHRAGGPCRWQRHDLRIVVKSARMSVTWSVTNATLEHSKPDFVYGKLMEMAEAVKCDDGEPWTSTRSDEICRHVLTM